MLAERWLHALPPHTSSPLCQQVVVLTEAPLAEAIRVDEYCHAHGIAFIKARGVEWVFSLLWLLAA